MKLDTIREFLLLSVNRNFSKTAEELYIAQSALTGDRFPLIVTLGGACMVIAAAPAACIREIQ